MRKNYQKCTLNAAYTVAATSFGNITGLSLICLKTGLYSLKLNVEVYINGTNRGTALRFAVDGNGLNTPSVNCYSPTSQETMPACLVADSVYLKKGAVVTAQAAYTTNSVQIYQGNNALGYLSIKEE